MTKKKRNQKKRMPPIPPVMPPVKKPTIAERLKLAEANIATLRADVDFLQRRVDPGMPGPQGPVGLHGPKGDKGDKGDKGGFSFGG